MTPDSPAPTPAPPAAPLPARTINPAIDVMMEPQRGFNLRQFWHALLERIWIVALCVLAGLFVALGYLGKNAEDLSVACGPRGRFPGADLRRRRRFTDAIAFDVLGQSGSAAHD